MLLKPLYTIRFFYPDGWEVRVPKDIPPDRVKQADVKLVFDVAEIVWESPKD